MKLLDRYIFNQVLFATLFGILLFIVVWISPEIMPKIIKQVIYGDLAPLTGLHLFFCEIPEILGKAIPVGLMFGTLFVFNRLSSDSELTIIRGIGVSFPRLIIPVMVLSLLGVGLSLLTYDVLMPYSSNKIRTIKQDYGNGHFVYLDKHKNGKPKQVFIVENYDGKNIRNVKFLKFSDYVSNKTPLISKIIIANEAEYMGNHWTLNKVNEFEIAPDGVYKNVKNYDSISVLTTESANIAHELLKNSIKKHNEMRIMEQKAYIRLLEKVGLQEEYRYMVNKLHQRYAQSFSCIFLALCGILLGFSRPREKRFIGFTLGVGLIFLYYVIIPFLDMLTQTGLMNPFAAAWTPNLIVVIVCAVLYKLKRL